jgi:hypothetical protein
VAVRAECNSGSGRGDGGREVLQEEMGGGGIRIRTQLMRGGDEAKAVSSDVSKETRIDAYFAAAPLTPDSDCLSSATCTLGPSRPVDSRW